MSDKKENKPKIIRINLSLIIGIITVFFILLSSIASYKIATIGTNVLYSLGEELADNIENDEDDGDNAEENIDEGEDEYTSTETDENGDNSDIAIVAENYDDEIAVVASLVSYNAYIVQQDAISRTIKSETLFKDLSWSNRRNKYGIRSI